MAGCGAVESSARQGEEEEGGRVLLGWEEGKDVGWPRRKNKRKKKKKGKVGWTDYI